MSWWDDISSFWSSNKDWIKPVVSTGIGALQQSNKDDAQSQYLQYLRDRENKNFTDSQAAIEAYNAQLAAAGGGGGGGSGGGGSNDAARMAQSAKANKISQNTYKKILKMYKPYKETADRLLPQMTGTYENSLGLQNALASFVNSPTQVAKLNGSIPAYQVNVPLPDSVRLK